MTTAQDRGWGPPGCTAAQLVRVQYPGMLDAAPHFPLRVRREVAPLFTELVRWLVTERARAKLPPLTSSGGYNKRLQRGSTSEWSNHSWGLAGDFNAATNPMQATLRTDMPPGTSAKAKSLGLIWGGDYTGRRDPMHFEFCGTPDDAARRVADLNAPAPAPLEEDDMLLVMAAGKAYLLTGKGLTHIPTAGDLRNLQQAGVRSVELSEELAKRLSA